MLSEKLIKIQEQSGNPSNELKRNIFDLAKLPANEVEAFLIDLLKSSKTAHQVKNWVALVLGDLKINKAVPVIISLVKSRKENIGTLLYALDKLPYFEYISDIVQVLLDGNFESRQMAFNLIEKSAGTLTFSEKDKILSQLENLQQECVNRHGVDDLDNRMDFITQTIRLIRTNGR